MEKYYNKSIGKRNHFIRKKARVIMVCNVLKRIQFAFLAMLLLTGIQASYAQDSLLVKGTILDGADRPVQGVSVGVEGSFELPSVTDENGAFTLKSESGNVWLNIAPSSGYKAKRIFLDSQTDLKIYVTDDDLAAGDDKIVILGQTRLRKNIVFAFNTITTEDIITTPALSIDQYMQGRISGMHIVNRSGHPAAGTVSNIRGINSLNSTNAPLYVVDGVPIIRKGVFSSIVDGFEYNPLLTVNVMDVSKVTVIKDPALTAAYGSKASNGLVLIETLDPSSTQTSIELDLRKGYSLAPDNLIPQMNADQHKTFISEMLFSSGLEEELVREQYPQLFMQPGDDGYFRYQHNTNWQQLIFSDAAFNNLNIEVKGGDEIARYGLSFGYFDGEGIITNTAYTDYNIRFRGLLNIFTWLKMNSGVSLNYNSALLKESARVSETSPIMTSLAKSPMLHPYQYDDDGNELAPLRSDVTELGVSNPLAVIESNQVAVNNFNSIIGLGFEIELKENMNVKTDFGVNYTVLEEEMYMPYRGMDLYYNDEAINVAKVANNSLYTLNNITALNYIKEFGPHRITSAIGVNIQNNSFQFDWALTKNAPDNDKYRRLQDGTPSLREIGGDNRVWNWLSVYENFTYSYQDKYMAVVSLSLDGSSRIGANALNTIKIGGVPFGSFYSAGVAWRLSNEAFLRDISDLEELKVRVSYGRTGNDDIGESNATSFYRAIRYRETVGLIPATYSNEELTYETNDQLNAGIDLGLWGYRLKASVDAYVSITDNMLIYTPLDAYLGYRYRPENGGSMRNAGIDVNFSFRMINMPNFNWDIQATYSTVQNKIVDMKVDKLVIPVDGAEIVNMPGEQANSFYGYIFDGVYSTQAEAKERGLVNNKNIPYQAGDAIFRDMNGDSVINNLDKTVIGSAIPAHWGGVGNTLTYKRWSMNVFIQFVAGQETFNYTRYKNESMTGIENQSTKILDRWQYDGQETAVPRAVYDDVIGNSAFSTRWIEDGSYARLKNISLSYTIPDKFIVFKSARVYVSATNLFVWTKYLGYDPEFSFSSSPLVQGIDYGITPQARQFIFGVKLGL